ncbi:MAG: YdcF family protein [Candidatus Thiodiazotropha sp.]
MQFDPERGSVDWDGLFTFFLTLLLLMAGLGIPLLISTGYIYRTARTQGTDCAHSSLLVFGKRLVRGQIDTDYQRRLAKALDQMRADASAQLLLVGGAAPGEQISEAQAGRDHLVAHGIPEHRLRLEQQSQNTLENLRHARSMLEQEEAFPVTLISNRYHLARISTIATSLGMEHQLCACEERFEPGLSLVPRMLMEGWYVLWFQTGKAWSRLIRSERMLSRVT